MNSVVVYLPSGEQFSTIHGGALATWTREVYGRLAGCWKITIAAPGFTESPQNIRCVRVSPPRLMEVLYQRIRNREAKGLLNPVKHCLRTGYARLAAKAIAAVQPDMIHIHNDPEAVVPIRRRNPHATIVLHMNNDHLIEGEATTAINAVQAADWVAFCSQYVMDGALAKVKGLRREQCFIIHNGADLPPEMAASSANFKSETGPVILFLGRIVEQKGLHVLLAAMPQVLKHFPTATLRIVGGVRFGSNEVDGYLSKLQAQAALLGERVQFVGPVSHAEIGKRFQEADVFACPSIWNEPLGMVNLEAIGAGVPVVAFARGGIPEAVGNAGLLVKEVESAQLAAALVRLLSDAELRQELGRKGRERVARYFSWDVIARQWEAQLQNRNLESRK